MSIDQVENIAQGRVWLGEDAIKIKLVDELGGLDKAVAKAAKLAKDNDYKTCSYPAPKSIFEQILNTEQNDYNNLDEHLQMLLGEYYEPFKIVSDFEKMDKVQARMPYIIKIK